MAKVRFFGESRVLLKTNMLEVDGKTIKEIIRNIDKRYEISCKQVLKHSVIFVNNVSFSDLKRFKTTIKATDEIVFLSPVAGG